VFQRILSFLLAQTSTPYRVYSLVGIPLLLGFLIITPPFQVADEHVHFLRAYHLSNGSLKAVKRDERNVGAELPADIRRAIEDLLIPVMHKPESRLDREAFWRLLVKSPDSEKIFQNFHNTALYAPPAYIPQILAIWTGRLLGFNHLVQFYLARFAAAMTAWWLTLLALRRLPVGRWSLFAAALTPMTLFQMASASADALTIAYAFFFTTLVLNSATTDRGMSPKRLWLLLSLACAVTLSKTAYLVLPGLILLVPVNRLPRKRLTQALCLIVPVVLPLLWTVWVQDIYIQGRRDPSRNIVPAEQLAHVIGNPFEFIATLAGTLTQNADFYRDSLIGYLGWLDTPLPRWLIYAYLIVLVLAASLDREKRQVLSGSQIAVIAGVLVANTVLIFLMLYLSWSDVGASVIEGIQGRYFIPLLPLALILISTISIPVKHKWRGSMIVIVLAIAALAYAISCHALWHRYYG
jgi:uncharacterized membrane protein